MSSYKELIKEMIKGFVYEGESYEDDDFDKELSFEGKLSNTLCCFIEMTDSVTDPECYPYFINALGVLDEENKVKVCEILADKACDIVDNKFSESSIEQWRQAKKIKEFAFKTMFIHSFLPNSDYWQRDSLEEMQKTPAGAEYVDTAVNMLATIQHVPVNSMKAKYGIK